MRLASTASTGTGQPMLARGQRLHTSAEFTTVVRGGRRAARPLLTVHLLLTDAADLPRAGLIVSKAVGGAVVRNAVARRLRHLLRRSLAGLAPGSRLVVRAAPGAGRAGSSALGADLDTALSAALRPRGPAHPRPPGRRE